VSTPFKSEWLEQSVAVPVDIETTAVLLHRVQEDTALLRQALKVVEDLLRAEYRRNFPEYPKDWTPEDKRIIELIWPAPAALIAALRERLGEQS